MRRDFKRSDEDGLFSDCSGLCGGDTSKVGPDTTGCSRKMQMSLDPESGG